MPFAGSSSVVLTLEIKSLDENIGTVLCTSSFLCTKPPTRIVNKHCKTLLQKFQENKLVMEDVEE